MSVRFARAAAMLVLSLGVTANVRAQAAFYDYAPVIDVTPIVEEIRVPVSRDRCWYQKVPGRGHYSYTPAVVGGIIGGVIGSQISKGDRRRVATVAGSLLGASLGHDWRNRRYRAAFKKVRRCEVVEDYAVEEQAVAFRVEYRYQGHTFVTRMADDPGDEVRIRVSLRPDD